VHPRSLQVEHWLRVSRLSFYCYWQEKALAEKRRPCFLTFAVHHLERFRGGALRILILDGNGLVCLTEGLVKKNRNGAFADAPFFASKKSS
jgi:hypothetical protein